MSGINNIKRNITINQTCNCNGDNCTQIGIIRNDEVYVMQISSPKREGPVEFTCSMPEPKPRLKDFLYKIVEKLNSLIGWIIDTFNDI